MKAGPIQAARLVMLRDLRLAFRKPSQLLQPLMFFMIVATLFPLTLTPELSRLRDAAPGVLWVGALLSSLLALEFLFREAEFSRIAIEYRSPVAEAERLLSVPGDDSQAALLNENFERIGSLLFGAQDYALIATR